MHACGHDGHTAIGMGVARLLAQHKEHLRGRVKLVFQPAEEISGGALAMIADGVLENPAPAAAFGLHLWSRLPLNQVVVQSGPLWATADRFDLIIHGKGGHGATPHDTIDTTLVASQIVVALQSIVARNVNPTETAVVTVGSFFRAAVPSISSRNGPYSPEPCAPSIPQCVPSFTGASRRWRLASARRLGPATNLACPPAARPPLIQQRARR